MVSAERGPGSSSPSVKAEAGPLSRPPNRQPMHNAKREGARKELLPFFALYFFRVLGPGTIY